MTSPHPEERSPAARRGRAADAAVAIAPVLLLGLGGVVLVLSERLRAVLYLGSRAPFADLAQVTYSSDCELPDAGEVGATDCDPWGRAYNYPPVWALTFRALGIGRAETTWVAVILIGAALVAIGAGLVAGRRHLSMWSLLAVGATVAAPPMTLMIVRANTDLFILILVVASVAIAGSPRIAALSPVLIGLAAGLKLYPVGAILGQSCRRALLTSVATSAVAISVLALPWLTAIRQATPSTVGASFGAGVLPAYIRGGNLVTTEDQLVGAGVVIAAVAILLCLPATRTHFRTASGQLVDNWPAGAIAVTGLGLYASSYLLTTSFDYRLFTLIFAVAGMLSLPVKARQLTGARLVAALALATCWFTYPVRSWQWIGDVFATALAIGILALLVFVLARRLAVITGARL